MLVEEGWERSGTTGSWLFFQQLSGKAHRHSSRLSAEDKRQIISLSRFIRPFKIVASLGPLRQPRSMERAGKTANIEIKYFFIKAMPVFSHQASWTLDTFFATGISLSSLYLEGKIHEILFL